MKKLGKIMLVTAASVGLAAAAGAAMAPESPVAEVRVEPARPAQSQQQQAPSEKQTVAVNEERRRLPTRRASLDIPTKHKNRRSGERAHRRWRHRKASGRAA